MGCRDGVPGGVCSDVGDHVHADRQVLDGGEEKGGSEGGERWGGNGGRSSGWEGGREGG